MKSLDLVPRDFIEDVVKVARHGDEIEIVCGGTVGNTSVRRVAANVGGKALESHVMNVEPPRIDYVIPQIGSKHTGVSAHFNGDYLGDVALVTGACPPTVKVISRTRRGQPKKTEKIFPPVLMCPPVGALDPVLFKVQCPTNLTDWTVLVMPVRT